MQLAFVPPSASPIRRQYLALKRQHPDAILLFQLGDFYETFEDDARTVAEVCEVALTSREMGRGERYPMAGVPVHAAETYIARLVERGYHVAICQQIEEPPRPASGKGQQLVRREVTRVITPGTLVDPPLLHAEQPNYLAAVALDRRGVGLAHADISTGEFACVEIEGSESSEMARSELWRLQPAECLVADAGSIEALAPTNCSLTEDASLFSSAGDRLVCEHFHAATLAALGLEDRRIAARAVAAILRYLARTQPQASAVLDHLRIYEVHGHMVLDPATRTHLEMERAGRGGREGALLHTIDRTLTPMGARLLARWLSHPLLDKPAIEARLDAVEAFFADSRLRQEVRDGLARLPDLERLAARAGQGLLAPREAIALAEGLAHCEAPRSSLLESGAAPLAGLGEPIDPSPELVAEIRATLADDPPAGFGEGVIRPGRIGELDELRTHSRDSRQWLIELERRERERTGLKNLKVGYNRVFGYYLEASTAALNQTLDYYRQQESGVQIVSALLDKLGYQRRQTLTSVERFVTPELREHELRQARSAQRMAELERDAYEQLGRQIASHSAQLLASARALAEADVLASWAQLAEERGYVRPQIVEEPVTEILGGRHPAVEAVLGWDAYIPADALLGGWGLGVGDREGSEPVPQPPAPNPCVMLLTGPNMAGKTTYGRMVLLVTLLGQCGCFVPAERARLGLVDRVFLRSGAGDDISAGQSTFMVEMTETAAILRNASSRSLAFFDEVGRGTSTYDGMSIARAIVEYLASPERGCRTIFSTHYHELATIQETHSTVRNYQMEVQESPGGVFFTYRVMSGSADRSYGVYVARLAGLPTAVVARAEEVLAQLEATASSEFRVQGSKQNPSELGARSPEPRPPEVVYDLAEIPVERTTPVEALALLDVLRAKARRSLGHDSKGGVGNGE